MDVNDGTEQPTEQPTEQRGGARRIGETLAPLRRMLEERNITPVAVPDETPQDIARQVRAHQQSIARGVWQRTLETWPDHDFSGARLDRLYPHQRPEEISAWLRDPDARLLLLVGPTGRGKSHAAFAIGNFYAEQGRPVRAYKHSAYVDGFKPGADEVGENSPATLRKHAQDAGLLLLDEFGAGLTVDRATGAASPFVQRETGDVVSRRLRQDGRRTVITSNLKWAELRALLDDRILSRIVKRAVILRIEGPDLRGGDTVGWEDW